MPIDLLISEMISAGLQLEDLKHLEKLDDRQVLLRLPRNRFLKHNSREDVVDYMNAWADLLEEKLLEKIQLTELFEEQLA